MSKAKTQITSVTQGPTENIFGANKHIMHLRHVGDLKKVYLEEDGTTVDRAPFLEYEGMKVRIAPYDNHFCFRHVYKVKGRPSGWGLWCSCGSPAGVVGFEVIKKDDSSTDPMVVCLHHATYNKHADGSS